MGELHRRPSGETPWLMPTGLRVSTRLYPIAECCNRTMWQQRYTAWRRCSAGGIVARGRETRKIRQKNPWFTRRGSRSTRQATGCHGMPPTQRGRNGGGCRWTEGIQCAGHRCCSAALTVDRFELSWKLDGQSLLLALDTDLPDAAGLNVWVGRRYYEAGNDQEYARDYFNEKSNRNSEWQLIK